MAAFSRPFASAGVDGETILRPGIPGTRWRGTGSEWPRSGRPRPPPSAPPAAPLLLVRDVPELGRLVGQAVHGQPHEVTEHDLEDRAQTGDRRPERGSREGQLGDRVSKTRSSPKRSCSSGVAMKTPPAAATSSPKKITDSSRAISSASASRIAARNSSLSSRRLTRRTRWPGRSRGRDREPRARPRWPVPSAPWRSRPPGPGPRRTRRAR